MKKKLPDFKTEDNLSREDSGTARIPRNTLIWPYGKAPKTCKSQTVAEDDIAAAAGFDDADLKVLANHRDVPYQSLLKVFLAERLTQERQWQR